MQRQEQQSNTEDAQTCACVYLCWLLQVALPAHWLLRSGLCRVTELCVLFTTTGLSELNRPESPSSDLVRAHREPETTEQKQRGMKERQIKVAV